ncbi:MAG: response regulator transcription factor [Campylobacterota bacterium]|nr:response regulator transcription factor [Campylobacterota bacterium]
MSNKKESYSVLYVEDEKEIRENYIKYLKRLFEHVYEAVDGREGLQVYNEKKPDILIVDINLPELNGLSLVRQVREYDHTTRVIMLTAHSDAKYLLEATELKLTKYLIKPISRSELREALDMVVSELSTFDVKSKKRATLRDGYYWNFDKAELFHYGSLVVLTNKEQILLNLLFSNKNRVFTYESIIMSLWSDSFDDKQDSLKTIIKNLRKKLPEGSIENVFGRGYKIEI